MEINKQEKEKRFNELFDNKQKVDEELRNYVLSRTPIIGDKKLKELLEKARLASNDYYDFLLN
jgi:ABC-type oligopeptide transport system ATPase subunit